MQAPLTPRTNITTSRRQSAGYEKKLTREERGQRRGKGRKGKNKGGLTEIGERRTTPNGETRT